MRQHVADKTAIRHPKVLPPRFWDNLSIKWLTKGALAELDRRNCEALTCPSKTASRRTNVRTPQASSAERQTPAASSTALAQLPSVHQTAVRRFARRGGPDLTHLRGYRPPIDSESETEMSPSRSPLCRRKRGSDEPVTATRNGQTAVRRSEATPTTTTGPYDSAFHQHLLDYSILVPGYYYPTGERPPKPDNFEEIFQILAQPRASTSPTVPTAEIFDKFDHEVTPAWRENEVVTSVIPFIAGQVGDPRTVARDTPFSNLRHLTDGTLVRAVPDHYYGARPDQLDKSVREELNHLIIPATRNSVPVVPNNFLEIKGPCGNAHVATLQATYDACLGARGFRSLQSYGADEPYYDRKAHVLAWTFQGITLTAYSCHVLPPSAGNASHAGSETRPTYVMTRINGWLLGNLVSFRQGVAAFRNGIDWAQSERDEVIAQANQRASATALAQVNAADSSVPPDGTAAPDGERAKKRRRC